VATALHRREKGGDQEHPPDFLRSPEEKGKRVPNFEEGEEVRLFSSSSLLEREGEKPMKGEKKKRKESSGELCLLSEHR